VYTKVDRDTGDVIWILGGPTSQFTGDGSSWNAQHGFHLLALDRILIFNNNGGGGGGGGGSLALEIALDLGTMTATREWEYNGGIANQVMGDVQRLSNGNTLVTYSTQGIMHEVDQNGGVVQELTWGLGGAVGYAMHRESLYGPPPK
jgi:hypothetical protein